MEFQLLGLVQAREGDKPIPLSGAKIHTVLAILLMHRGHVVSDEKISAALWGWDPPATRSAQIYTYVSRLRKRLGPEVEFDRIAQGYTIRIGRAPRDLEEFTRCARLGREALDQHRFYDAAVHLSSALALWRGPVLANVTEHFAEAERPGLEEARTVALEYRIDADLALGRHQQVVPELTGLLKAHPLREKLRAQLMLALLRCGRQADAVKLYLAGRRVLADELGVDPGPVLDEAYRAILNAGPEPKQEPGSRAGSAPEPDRERPIRPRLAVLPRAASVPALLPPRLDDFIGRDRELHRVREWLTAEPGHVRAALLTGMPGVGKSALAVQAAHLLSPDFPDGQLYADLSRADGSPKNPWEILSGFLNALHIAPAGEAADLDELVALYRTHTAGKQPLVVLDHGSSARQISPLMPNDAGVGVIVTSRGHLVAVPGRQALTLPLLSDPEAQELLAAIAGVDRLGENGEATEEIIRACAGLPLALRIAGLRLAAHAHWSTGRLARRLAAPQTRLDELTFGELDVTGRLLGSLKDVSPVARQALPQLALIPMPRFPAEAAARALGTGDRATEEVLDDLVGARLLEVSLLDRPQYGFHELVRLFARTVLVDKALGHAA